MRRGRFSKQWATDPCVGSTLRSIDRGDNQLVAHRGSEVDYAGSREQPVDERASEASRCSLFGGGGGIRTHGSLTTTPVFKTGALNHSATPPGEGAELVPRRHGQFCPARISTVWDRLAESPYPP